MSARVRVALIVLGAAVAPSAAFGAGRVATTRPATANHPLTTSPVARAAQSGDGELSQTPPVTLSPRRSGSKQTSPPTTTPATLPDTGADLPTNALLGLGLLASGIGLRLRTVDERIF